MTIPRPGSLAVSRTREWLVIHRSDRAVEVLDDDALRDSRAQLVPVMVLARNAEERDHIVSDLVLRLASSPPPDNLPEEHVIDAGELRIEKDAHRVSVDGEVVSLTKLEFKLLVTLAQDRDRVLLRRELLRDVWAIDTEQTNRRLDVQVTRLRAKLRGASRFIQTVRGVGYRFSESVPVQQLDA